VDLVAPQRWRGRFAVHLPERSSFASPKREAPDAARSTPSDGLALSIGVQNDARAIQRKRKSDAKRMRTRAARRFGERVRNGPRRRLSRAKKAAAV
jgi:hypothetical protein